MLWKASFLVIQINKQTCCYCFEWGFSCFPELNLCIDLGKKDVEHLENKLIYIECTLFKKAGKSGIRPRANSVRNDLRRVWQQIA